MFAEDAQGIRGGRARVLKLKMELCVALHESNTILKTE